MYYNNDTESQLRTLVSLAFLMERNADFHNAHTQKNSVADLYLHGANTWLQTVLYVSHWRIATGTADMNTDSGQYRSSFYYYYIIIIIIIIGILVKRKQQLIYALDII